MRILGLDPGSLVAGFAVIDVGDKLSYVESGVIRLKGDLPTRLVQLSDAVSELVQTYQPNQCAIESLFMHRNVKSLMVLCHARGVMMQAVMKHQVTISEYEPRLVKKTVVGYGSAKKSQVGFMASSILGITGILAEDASDALAIAMTHAQHRGVYS
ncbi:crossover junction endodeoxyribonuclease RuvC [Gammaproteobacteria bacterium]|nr:crossover junction endodeoxyribonuclease RuvC [Gammaproteobacteria bacterium]